ncbi:phosphopantetheine-binding protein [Streptomyces sp. P17]|uniref:phosphopantetheine-binding protein n=1 Tax=Streptomyces sp. P17 TaxID=3074716 RepID=UPI0028F4546A|nr:phosphopantetheine-binding protein [Streptomyces sp. P17]MDT9701392.1 phosphopantetheine-binding protein [Streptomyces sp. P17]
MRFADGLRTLLDAGDAALVEVGPGRTLSTLAGPAVAGRETTVVPSMRHPRSDRSDPEVLAEAVGSLWTTGVEIGWRARQPHRRRAARLPLYPFERRRHWLTQPAAGSPPEAAAPAPVAPAATVTAEAAPVAADDPFEGPDADVRRSVAGIWSELLGVPLVVPSDNFFDLGGHSLLGTRLATRLRERFGVEVRLRELFTEPTVAGQAALVVALSGLARTRPERRETYEEGEL